MSSVGEQKVQDGSLKRELGERHIRLMALGACIGVGLFLGSAKAIQMAGPAIMISYILGGLAILVIMRALGEMAVHNPVAGSFSQYAKDYLGPLAGFITGWNYWFLWLVTCVAEITAVAVYMGIWFPDVPRWIWALAALASMGTINLIAVRAFGESEFWFALIKVVTVVIFIGVGLATIFGIMHGVESPGFSNFTMGDAPFVGGFQAMVGVAMIAGFSFQGTELIGIAAGESENPRKNIPIAIRQVFWRILMFYILAIFVIGMLIPYTDPNLLKNDASDISVSPFTLLFERAGFAAAAGVMNAVILSAILSAGNSGMYASTRMLYNLALEGKAPRLFSRVSRSGVPRNALYATTLVGALCFLTSAFGDSTVYTWLLNTSGMCGFIAWLGIAISHYRFRKGYLAQGGRLEDLPYRAKLFPFGPLFAFALCMVITLGQNYQALVGERIDWIGLLATYISLPLFLAIWLGYRWKKRARFVRYHEMDVSPTNT